MAGAVPKGTLVQRIRELEQEVKNTEEMLAHVLLAVGEPVVVSEEMLARGFSDDIEIYVENDVVKNTYTFSVRKLNE